MMDMIAYSSIHMEDDEEEEIYCGHCGSFCREYHDECGSRSCHICRRCMDNEIQCGHCDATVCTEYDTCDYCRSSICGRCPDTKYEHTITEHQGTRICIWCVKKEHEKRKRIGSRETWRRRNIGY
jgi:hypothetical protein